MKQLALVGFNLLKGYPTGGDLPQAEIILTFNSIKYKFDSNNEAERLFKTKSIRFISEVEQLKDLANQLLEVAKKLEEQS